MQLRTINGAEIMTRERTPIRHHIRRWVPAGGYTLVNGEPGTGKTWIGLSMAVAISTGTEWMGCRTTQAPVIYLAGESKDDLVSRLQAYAEGTGIVLPDTLTIIEDSLSIDRGRDLVEIEQLVIRTGAKLIIVDPLVRCLRETDENNNQEVRECMERVCGTLGKHGCDILLVHHTAKGTANGIVSGVYGGRGAGDWGGGATSVISLNRKEKEGGVLIEQEKLCNGIKAEAIVAVLHQDYREGETDDYLHAATYGTPTTKQEIVDRIDAERIKQVVDILTAEGPMSAKSIEAKTGYTGGTRKRILAAGREKNIISYDSKQNVYSAC